MICSLLLWIILLFSASILTSQAEEHYLLFANRQFVTRLSLNNLSITNLYDVHRTSVVGLNYDMRTDDLFWSNTFDSSIVHADMTGAIRRRFNFQQATTIESIAWDWINNKLYWADSRSKTVEVMDINTGYKKVLLQFTNVLPRIIILDPIRRWMYWSAWTGGVNQEDGQIVRTSMDGQNTTSTVLFDSSQVVWPNGLSLDFETQTLYWVDALKNTVSQSRADGTNHSVIIELNNTNFRNEWHTFGLDYFNGEIYFGEWFSDSLFTFSINSPISTFQQLLQTGHDIGTIHVVHPQKQPSGDNPCAVDNGGCSHLCLLSALEPYHRRCVCPDGVDPDDCTETTASPRPVFPSQYAYNFSNSNIQSNFSLCSEEVTTFSSSGTLSSFLFDGIVPTPTIENGTIQTNQLLTLRSHFVTMTFNFSGTPNYDTIREIELVLINSEELGSSVAKITLHILGVQIKEVYVNITSRNSLVTVCIPGLTINSTEVSISILTANPLHWIYFAEVKFYAAARDVCQIVSEVILEDANTSLTTTTYEVEQEEPCVIPGTASPRFVPGGEPPRTVVVDVAQAELVLPCRVNGTPAPHVSWFREGSEINSMSILDNGTLAVRVSDSNLSRQGTIYYCLATHTVTQRNLSMAVLRSCDVNVSLSFFDGFKSTAVRDVVIPTVVGGAVALECDYAASNPPPVVQWYADGTMLDVTSNNHVLYLEGGRYLYIRELNATQRTMRYHCEVNNFHDENGMPIRAPTTYTLNALLANVGITEYRGLGSQVGRVGEPLQFVYVAGSRDAASNFVPFRINCFSTTLVMLTTGGFYVVIATLTTEVEQEIEVYFTCELIGIRNVEVMGTIIVSRPTTIINPLSDAESLSDQDRVVGDGPVVYFCVASGVPTPTITWYYNGVIVHPGSGGSVVVDSNGTLIIQEPWVNHSGIYQCFARNRFGEDSRAWILEVREDRVIVPVQYSFNFSMSVGGSSSTGHCLSVHSYDGLPVCFKPTTSVLFDGNIPTLIGLDGSRWASQLYATASTLTFNFTGIPGYIGVRRIEIVIFNCEVLGASVQNITLSTDDIEIAAIHPTITSCDFLVRVCIPNLVINCTSTLLSLSFLPANPSYWVHIAEVQFRDGSSDCPQDSIIDTSTVPTEATKAVDLTTTPFAFKVNIQYPSYAVPITITAIIAAITTIAIVNALMYVASRRYPQRRSAVHPVVVESEREEQAEEHSTVIESEPIAQEISTRDSPSPEQESSSHVQEQKSTLCECTTQELSSTVTSGQIKFEVESLHESIPGEVAVSTSVNKRERQGSYFSC